MKPTIGKPPNGRYAFTGEHGGKSWDRKVRASKGRGKGKKLAMPEPFEQWLRTRIPGRPKPALGGYQPAEEVAALRLREGNRTFRRHLLQDDAQEDGWWLAEPVAAFRPWRLVSPDDVRICGIEFWVDRRTGRPFGIGQDETGARWWVVPADRNEESPTRWLLKRQAPAVVAVPTLKPESSARTEADTALAAFKAAGRHVTKLTPQETPTPKSGGRGLRKWKRGER